ncbi:hypothetical protein [Methanofervidicoccus abyssi]|uniref:Uncharacterized protein n=1 Tax=Methanofervidicoccus abyssi TaxID=2082189 RepID=A0A401HRM5_9EURY|nr:hypothetical protein MHHB_P1103 [Methanofervidicoccus abyssi]
MEEKGDNFYIYRVYGAGRKDAKILKIRNPANFGKREKLMHILLVLSYRYSLTLTALPFG